MRPTTFYRSDCNKLASFVQDAGEIHCARAANLVAVDNPGLLDLRDLYGRPRRQETIHRDQVRLSDSIQADSILDPELTGPRTAKRREMRAAPSSLPEIMHEADAKIVKKYYLPNG